MTGGNTNHYTTTDSNMHACCSNSQAFACTQECFCCFRFVAQCVRRSSFANTKNHVSPVSKTHVFETAKTYVFFIGVGNPETRKRNETTQESFREVRRLNSRRRNNTFWYKWVPTRLIALIWSKYRGGVRTFWPLRARGGRCAILGRLPQKNHKNPVPL